MPDKKEYLVYFRQINQTCVRVIATNEEEARKKARKEWLEDNVPSVIEVQVDE